MTVLDQQGRVLLDMLVRPGAWIANKATTLHDICNRMVLDAPAWPDVHAAQRELLACATVVIYSATFDERLVRQTSAGHGLGSLACRWEYAMAQCVAFNPQHRAPFELYLLDGTPLRCHTAIVATGATYRLLDAPGIESLIGRGVYYGTALGEAPTYAERDVFVVGGGNSAGQTALHLVGYARSVTLLVRGGRLQHSMFQYLIDQLDATENVEIWLRRQAVRAEGKERLSSLVIARGGTETTCQADGLFVLIGQRPATDWAEGVLVRDRRGFLVTGPTLREADERAEVWLLARDPLPLETNEPGIFATGDVRHGAVNRVAWAVGEAAMAVQLVHQYLGKYAERDFEAMRDLPQASAPTLSRVELRLPEQA